MAFSPSKEAKSGVGIFVATEPHGFTLSKESGLYYLQSRYYNSKVGRFINADAYAATGQGLLGNNMFAYCGNSPTGRTDTTGLLWEDFWDAFSEALQEASAYFALSAGITQIDSPVPGPADAVGAAMVLGGFLACTVIAAGTVLFPTKQFEVAKKTEKTSIPVLFPADPYSFNPLGLVRVCKPGTKNGAIINWMDPITNTAVFRWDENINYSNGAHYHILGAGHYYPGDVVPEPFATIFFPFS